VVVVAEAVGGSSGNSENQKAQQWQSRDP